MVYQIYYKFRPYEKLRTGFSAGFTMVELIIAITLVGIGITSTVAALTKLNAFASTSRNATGAYSVVMNQIDRIQSAPAIPQDAPNGILIRADLTEPATPINGTQTLTNLANPNLMKIYQEPNGATILAETLTTTVAPVVIGGVTTYSATVTVQYKYQGRDYSFSMSTLRASDQ